MIFVRVELIWICAILSAVVTECCSKFAFFKGVPSGFQVRDDEDIRSRDLSVFPYQQGSE